MNHQDAINSNLVERYLLGEVPDVERSAFEEHYFSCAVCAQDLVMAVKFVDNARRPLFRLEEQAAPKEEARPSRPAPGSRPKEHWWDRWLALAPKPALAGACACLAIALVWQSAPEGARPEVTGSYFVTETRAGGGAPRRIVAGPGQKRVALLFNHTDSTVSQFRFVLENADGRAVQQFDGEAPRDTNDLQVMLPVAGLGAGVYTLRVRDAATQAEIAALPFELAIP